MIFDKIQYIGSLCMFWRGDMQKVFNRLYQRSSKHERHEVSSRSELKIDKAGCTLVLD